MRRYVDIDSLPFLIHLFSVLNSLHFFIIVVTLHVASSLSIQLAQYEPGVEFQCK